MRAICEACSGIQPADWQPGHLCTHCGQPVRREIRCFWCARWTPAGKFCRGCAAAVVEDRLYGAARMLKQAGVDRFGIPKMLAELDPDQVENFANIYQRHAAALTRHVDHVQFLEQFLAGRDWSAELEESLIGQLPWPDRELDVMSPPLAPEERPMAGRRPRAESLALARTISAITPIASTRSLALLVRLLLEDWEVFDEARGALSSDNPRLRGEAALALSHWRVVYGHGIQDDRYPVLEALRECPFRLRAAVALALLGDRETPLPAEAIGSDDADIAFSAAIASSDVDGLTAAARDSDPLKRYVAAWNLLRLGHLTGVGDAILSAAPGHQLDLLRQIGNRKLSPSVLRSPLYEVMEGSDDGAIRVAAAAALCRCWQPGDTLRIARAARGDTRIYQRLLQTPEIPPEELDALGGFLLERGEFRADQWGMEDAAKQGRVPATFVARRWAQATQAARVELCKFAEMQLDQYADEDLHRYLVNVAYGAGAGPVERQAWICLYRWYGRTDHTRMGPLAIRAESLRRFFGSVEAFVPILTRFLGSGKPEPILQDQFVAEPLTKFLRYSDADVVPDLRNEYRLVLDLANALKGVMECEECALTLRLACIDLLVLLAGAREFRPSVTGILESFRGTDLDLGASTGLQRILH